VIRVDPETEASSEIEVGETPDAMATGSEYVWVLDEFAGAVWRIDPKTERILRPIHLSGGLDRVAIGEGFVWVLDSALGTITPIDESTGEPRPAIDVGSDAEDVAVGLGSAWVASGGNVLEIDPLTLRVERTIDVSDTPILRLAVDATDGAIWLDFAPGTEHG
jgi:streptogramin lyase